MMPMSLALKRPADEVHLTDNALQHNATKLLESYKKRREDSLGGSDPSSSPHPEDSELDEEDMPAMESHQPFPCVWLNSANGLPLTISPIDPENKYEVVEPTDPGMEEENSQENTKQDSQTEKPVTNGDVSKPLEICPVSESIMSNGHYPEGSEADPAPPTNNGSTPPPISKTASVAESLGGSLSNQGMRSPGQPLTPNSLATMAANMNQPVFSTTLDTPTSVSSLMNGKMLSSVYPSGMATPGSETDENGENLEVCPECHKVFKRKVYLQRHMEREHWSTAKVFKCDDCSYETKHQSNLSVHRRIHTGTFYLPFSRKSLKCLILKLK